MVTPSKTIMLTKSLLVSTSSFAVTVFSGADRRVPTFQRLVGHYYARGSRRRIGASRAESIARGRAASVCRRIYTAARACVHRCAYTLGLSVTRRARGRRASSNRNGFVYCDVEPRDLYSYGTTDRIASSSICSQFSVSNNIVLH